MYRRNAESIDERILRVVDETKKYACLEYGWCINLWDREDEESGYPVIHLEASGQKGRIRGLQLRLTASSFMIPK